jgi:hypothetical protein
MNDARVPGSAADLKFLHRMPQLRVRNFKSKSGTAIMNPAGAPLIPKFA